VGDKMTFNINFNFENGQQFDVLMTNEELKRFLTTISKSEVYWDENGGFWIAFNKLLYFTVKEIKNEVESTTSPNKPNNGVDKESEDSE
jgi:hypothetical protein